MNSQREQIARLVDPKVFADAEAFPKVLKTKRYARAFETADAILSLKEEEKVGDWKPTRERWPEYETAIGDAGQKYLDSLGLATRLPGTFRWQELWDAMNPAAMISSSPKGMEPVAWRFEVDLGGGYWTPKLSFDEPSGNGVREVQPLYVSPVEGRTSRDHEQSTTDQTEDSHAE